MGKILVCGDVHCKKEVVDQALKLYQENNCDKLIFIGDYTDDWNDTVEQNIEILDYLFSLKYDMGEKLILLLGNHDISNWIGAEFKCSGFSEIKHSQLKFLYEANKYDFKMAHYENGFLFTHAGVCLDWLDNISKELAKRGVNIENIDSPEEINSLINNYKFVLSLFESDISPVWLRPTEKVEYPPFKQIVGHTPVALIENSRKNIIYIDTHSTAPNGERLGDGTFLIINPDESTEIV
jgi:metallophosphoesterase|nr:MAG TPA: metallophosphatase domain protein [Caudoviricetes sp.]